MHQATRLRRWKSAGSSAWRESEPSTIATMVRVINLMLSISNRANGTMVSLLSPRFHAWQQRNKLHQRGILGAKPRSEHVTASHARPAKSLAGRFRALVLASDLRCNIHAGRLTMQNLEQYQLIYDQGKYVVHVATHLGEEFFLRLAAQGIEATVIRRHGLARLEMEAD